MRLILYYLAHKKTGYPLFKDSLFQLKLLEVNIVYKPKLQKEYSVVQQNLIQIQPIDLESCNAMYRRS